MFCSASDEGLNRAKTTYPGNFKECFRIGAAWNDGVRFSWVHPLGAEFLLPGNQIPFHSPDKDSYVQNGQIVRLDGTYDLRDKEKMANAFWASASRWLNL
ncbi:hypothetical protein VE01_08089 [Pseudogymnoascus verrucosus]|uniref:Uncharacterized protein n=1 Tax=Pseudogymnoascus verrucosus TaxID=342668 RepID=A0A1B8GD17_9PEZI|nr:uncharacterized protein VE01_08089 [Pseudogymnoascus verrucosus]OBT93710.1 hypothetical protein VE01_08089 [Pseudogymnoascus verrucosus]